MEHNENANDTRSYKLYIMIGDLCLLCFYHICNVESAATRKKVKVRCKPSHIESIALGTLIRLLRVLDVTVSLIATDGTGGIHAKPH